jgi:hypothetical protein
MACSVRPRVAQYVLFCDGFCAGWGECVGHSLHCSNSVCGSGGWAIHCTVATGSVCVVAVVGPFIALLRPGQVTLSHTSSASACECL